MLYLYLKWSDSYNKYKIIFIKVPFLNDKNQGIRI